MRRVCVSEPPFVREDIQKPKGPWLALGITTHLTQLPSYNLAIF